MALRFAYGQLRIFPFLDDDVTVNALKQELPVFRAAAEDVTEVDPAKWWKNHADELPSWSSAVAKVLLVHPSSAAAERVFSRCFSKHFSTSRIRH